MKKHLMLIELAAVSLLCLFSSCEKEENNSRPNDEVDYTYLLANLEALLPIDLNFDGIENVDLSKEIDVIQYNNPLSCVISFSTRNDTLTITWPEPQAEYNPFTMPEIPSVYDGEVKYSLVTRHYTYWINNDQSMIYIKEIETKGAPNYFTFWSPTALIIDKERNSISFPSSFASQYFLTKEGVKSRGLSAVFKPYPANNYLK